MKHSTASESSLRGAFPGHDRMGAPVRLCPARRPRWRRRVPWWRRWRISRWRLPRWWQLPTTAAVAVGTVAVDGKAAGAAGTVVAAITAVATMVADTTTAEATTAATVAGAIPATATDGDSVSASTGDRFGAVSDIPTATLGLLPTIHTLTPTRIPILTLTMFPSLRRATPIRPVRTATATPTFPARAATITFRTVRQPSNGVLLRGNPMLLRCEALLPPTR